MKEYVEDRVKTEVLGGKCEIGVVFTAKDNRKSRIIGMGK